MQFWYNSVIYTAVFHECFKLIQKLKREQNFIIHGLEFFYSNVYQKLLLNFWIFDMIIESVRTKNISVW